MKHSILFLIGLFALTAIANAGQVIPPIRMAHGTGEISYGDTKVCDIDVSVPVGQDNPNGDWVTPPRKTVF